MQSNSNWHARLTAAGAHIDDDTRIADFGDPVSEARALREAAVLTPLLGQGLIAVSGRDALNFLNAQLTSDVSAVTPERAQYSGYCTPKGRLLATMLVFLRDASYHIVVPNELAQPVAARLQKYVMRADVRVQAASPEIVLLGLAGPRAAAALSAGLMPPGQRLFEVVRAGQQILITLPGQRYLLAAPTEQADEAWAKLSQHALPAGSDLWTLQSIRCGIATVSAATTEAFVPQMIALDRYGGVSFDKGCYPGQEIVARTRYLGDLKRRLYYGRSEHVLASGDAIVSAAGDASVGTVTDAASEGRGEWEFLAVVQRDAIANQADLRTRAGQPLRVHMPVNDLFPGEER